MRTPRSGVASRRTRSIERDVSLVLGGRAWVRSAGVSPRRDATCSARVITDSKGNPGGMGAWTARSQRRSWRSSARSSARPRPGRRSRCPRPRRPRRGLCLRLRSRPLRRRAPRKQVLGPLAEAGGVLRHVLRRPRMAASTARVGPRLPTVRSTLRPRLLHRRLRPVQLRRPAGKVVRGVLYLQGCSPRVAMRAGEWPPLPRVLSGPARPVRLRRRQWAVEAGRPQGL